MIKLLPSTDGKYYFTICGRNGNPVATSKMYRRHYNCYRAIMNILDTMDVCKGKGVRFIDRTKK